MSKCINSFIRLARYQRFFLRAASIRLNQSPQGEVDKRNPRNDTNKK